MNTAGTETTALDTVLAAAQIVFYLSPLLIALATLFLAWWRFKVFRVREPAIKTDLQVSSRRCSPRYNALSAVVVLTNTSRVAVTIAGLAWSVRVLSPYSDEEVESKISEYETYVGDYGSRLEFPWNVNRRISEENLNIHLEPGDSHTIGMSLAILDWIEAVDVLIEMDSTPVEQVPRLRWAARCPHDMEMEG